MNFILSPKILTAVLAILVGGLLVGHIATQCLKFTVGYDVPPGLLAFLNLDQENNLPSWYASSSLLLCSLLLAVIGLAKKRDGDRYAWHWLALSAIFLYLSLDEAASIHELAIDPLRRAFPRYTSGYLYLAWVIPGSLFVLAIGVMYLRFLIDLPAKTRTQFLLAGSLYVGGALGVELFEGKYASVHGLENLTIWMIVAVEEGLEMVGIVVFIYALSSYVASQSDKVVILFSNAANSLPAEGA
jgi:hypothetical protein